MRVNLPVSQREYPLAERMTLLSTTDTLESIALDKYSFVRDAYVQRRASLVAREAAEAPAAAASAASAP